MIDGGIFDGDIVVIRGTAHVEDGQAVVAIIDNNEATLKNFIEKKINLDYNQLIKHFYHYL